MNIISFESDNENYLGVIDKQKNEVLCTNKITLYDLMGISFTQGTSFKKTLVEICQTPFALSALQKKKITFKIPLLSSRQCETIISGFGLTHQSRLAKRGLKNTTTQEPEWFFKGTGHQLKTTGERLTVPTFARSFSEEAEFVMIYMNDHKGIPHYIGFTIGNDFSDPRMRKENPHNLGLAKLRVSAVAPEIRLAALPKVCDGHVKIMRDGQSLWENAFLSGTAHLLYDIDYLEDLLFRHANFREPGMVHYLFLGANETSFSSDIRLHMHDSIEIESSLLTLPLVNKIDYDRDI